MKISVTTEKEKNIFKSGYPMIVPFLVTEYGDDLEIEVYSGVKRFCKKLVKRYGKGIFSDEVLSQLNEELEKYANLHGYEGEKHERLRWYHSFSMRNAEKLDTSAILGSSVKIEEDVYINRTTYEVGENLEKNIPMFATLEDGKIVSMACVNEYSEGQKMLEITVETSPSYRKRGFARSNTAALAKYLIENGYSVAYCCSRYNVGSERIARSLGFDYVGRFYAYNAYKKR
ncbi:MAG: GNAT family N-acetyltransferase [Ruminococcaceae bacterium]|nr:GNAT family N-acetyltransferase [Oscillospiraceae bacterium]